MATPWVLPDDGIVDDVAVAVAAAGTRKVRLTPAEQRLAAVKILAELDGDLFFTGDGVNEIRTRLNMHPSAARQLINEIRAEQEKAA